MRTSVLGATVAALGLNLGLASVSQATIFTYATSDPALQGVTVNTAGGTVSDLLAQFDTVTDKFTWNVTFNDGVTKNTNAYWLVVSTGSMPMGNNQLAIIYLDATASITNPIVSIFRYGGQNDPTSYVTPGDLLATTLNMGQTDIMVSGSNSGASRTFNLMVDATAINNLFPSPPWDGIEFGQEIGLWFHPSTQAITSYAGNKLNFYGYAGPSGWYDGSHIQTPAPGALVLAGLAGVTALRRRRTA